MQCFRGKQNTSGWNDIVLRQQSGYMGPKQKGINSYVANNVRKISWPFVFSFAMDIDQTDEDDRGWVRLAILNILKILKSKIKRKLEEIKLRHSLTKDIEDQTSCSFISYPLFWYDGTIHINAVILYIVKLYIATLLVVNNIISKLKWPHKVKSDLSLTNILIIDL